MRVSATLGPHTLAFSSAHVCSRGASAQPIAAPAAALLGSSASAGPYTSSASALVSSSRASAQPAARACKRDKQTPGNDSARPK